MGAGIGEGKGTGEYGITVGLGNVNAYLVSQNGINERSVNSRQGNTYTRPLTLHSIRRISAELAKATRTKSGVT